MNNFSSEIFANDYLCQHLTVNEFKESFYITEQRDFSILNINIRSLKKHFTELQSFLHIFCSHVFSLIVVTETWLTESFDRSFHLDGYSFVSLFYNIDIRKFS